MVKIAPRALKIGVQSRFYPISTVGFGTFSPKILARPILHDRQPKGNTSLKASVLEGFFIQAKA